MLKEMTGLKFGRLTVTAKCQANTKNWICDCECGTKGKSIDGYGLRDGRTKSCGCLKKAKSDLTGQKFGKLTAIEVVGKSRAGNLLWSCNCDCGSKGHKASAGNLKAGAVTSCGCLLVDSRMGNLSHFYKHGNYQFNQQVYQSSKRGIRWELSPEEFKQIVSQKCYICNHPERKCGIDRFDNDIGYTLVNSRPCCKICNRMKWTLSFDDFRTHVFEIAKHLKLEE